MKRPAKTVPSQFDADQFIARATTAQADTPPVPVPEAAPATAQVQSLAKPAAVGYTRASFDLPDALHLRLKIAAAKQRRSMRAIVERALADALDTLEE